METIKLSSKGQVIIHKHIRESYHWDIGLELQVIESEDRVLLKPKALFERTSIDDVAACLQYSGPRKTDEDIALFQRRIGYI